jgi:hypothetical protein
MSPEKMYSLPILQSPPICYYSNQWQCKSILVQNTQNKVQSLHSILCCILSEASRTHHDEWKLRF